MKISFKSREDFNSIILEKLDTLLTEQRCQRADLAYLMKMVIKIKLPNQEQLSDYYDKTKTPILDMMTGDELP